MSFKIVTDSCANLSDELINEYDIGIVPLVYIINGEERLSYSKDSPSNLKQYYDFMRKKIPMSTACVSREQCITVFEEILDGGDDLLCIAFSSALSASFNVAFNIAEELKQKYPDRKIMCIDSLSASLGQGLLVTSAAKEKAKGKSIEEVYKWVEENRFKLVHLFTVENLSYLYRGGRVKKSSYLIANTLNIKPVMHVDNEGKLVAIGKVLGRKKSIAEIAKKTAEQMLDPKNNEIYIGHGDCIEDAEYFISILKNLITVKDIKINFIDLVIGAHSGPGTLAVFFLGKDRNN